MNLQIIKGKIWIENNLNYFHMDNLDEGYIMLVSNDEDIEIEFTLEEFQYIIFR